MDEQAVETTQGAGLTLVPLEVYERVMDLIADRNHWKDRALDAESQLEVRSALRGGESEQAA